MTNLHIKNMVCNRCKIVVKAELDKLGFNPFLVELGMVSLMENIGRKEKETIAAVLKPLGFELLTTKKAQIAEQVKNLIIDRVHYNTEPSKMNLSSFLSQQINLDYAQISAIFSDEEHQSIEKFYIAQKIERAKEFISYGELTLSEIAYQLHYSSVAHLSAQFKKTTGLTPTAFKEQIYFERRELDQI